MSFSILIFAFSIFAPTVHAAVIIQAPKYLGLTEGLVGFWSFDGADMSGSTAYDRSGQGNNGTLTNGPVRVAGIGFMEMTCHHHGKIEKIAYA